MGKDLEGSDCGIIGDTILAFVWATEEDLGAAQLRQDVSSTSFLNY
jgi:hypothetical protein